MFDKQFLLCLNLESMHKEKRSRSPRIKTFDLMDAWEESFQGLSEGIKKKIARYINSIGLENFCEALCWFCGADSPTQRKVGEPGRFGVRSVMSFLGKYSESINNGNRKNVSDINAVLGLQGTSDFLHYPHALPLLKYCVRKEIDVFASTSLPGNSGEKIQEVAEILRKDTDSCIRFRISETDANQEEIKKIKKQCRKNISFNKRDVEGGSVDCEIGKGVFYRFDPITGKKRKKYGSVKEILDEANRVRKIHNDDLTLKIHEGIPGLYLTEYSQDITRKNLTGSKIIRVTSKNYRRILQSIKDQRYE